MAKKKTKSEEDNLGLHSSLTAKSVVVEVEIKVIKRDPKTNKVISTETYCCEPNTGYNQVITKMNHVTGRTQKMIQIEGLLKTKKDE